MRRSTDEGSGLPVDDVRTATRGFRKCERLMSVPVTAGPSQSSLRLTVADGAALRAGGRPLLRVDNERLVGVLVRSDMGRV